MKYYICTFSKINHKIYKATSIFGNKEDIKMNESKFVKIRCPKCKNEQIMFGKAAQQVKCLVCDKILADPTGGKAKIKARVLEVLA